MRIKIFNNYFAKKQRSFRILFVSQQMFFNLRKDRNFYVAIKYFKVHSIIDWIDISLIFAWSEFAIASTVQWTKSNDTTIDTRT